MLFPIPDPALWDDPGPVPYRGWLRTLWDVANGDFFPSCAPWIEQYRRYYERLQRDEEEMARYLQQQAEYEALMAAYEEQGEHMAEMLPVYLHKLGLSYKRTVQDRKHEGRFFERVDYCRIEEWDFDEHAYYFQIDTGDLPALVRIDDFLDPRNQKTLSSNFGSHTTIEHNLSHPERPGLWVIVEHKAGRGLIPQFVEYSQMYKAIPKTAPPLTFPIGVASNSTARYADMDEIYTIGIFGQKGSGKSNIANGIICSWIQRARPDQLRLFLTDLKGGLEFYDYNGIPHLGGDVDIKMRLEKDGVLEPVRLGQEVLSEPYQVAPMLRYIEAEMERRQRLMRGKARKISAYNRKFKKKLSTWVIVIDELATLADSEYRKEAYKALAEIIRKGRAVGIYALVATQVPDKTVLTRQIAGNLDFRIVGYMSDGASSGLTLGDGSYDATRLPPDIKGRMVIRWNKKQVVQTPFISEMAINRIIKSVKEGRHTTGEDTEEAAIAQDLFSYALEYLGGLCSYRDLFAHFRNQIGQHKIKRVLKTYEVSHTESGLDPVIILDDDEYYLLPATKDGNNGRIPRQLMSLVDFEKERDAWLDIIQFRTGHGARVAENGNGVEGHNSKTGSAAKVELPISEERD